MSIKYGFFNSQSGDRTYNAEDITGYFDKIIGNGVFVDPANSLQVLANSGLNVTVKAGRGWIDGFFINSDADLAVTIDQADATLSRIDRIVFYLDKTNRTMGIRVNKGTAATTPVAPALVRTSDVQEYSLALISIPALLTNITQLNITDTRLDSTVCGKVAVLIDHVDTSDIYAQFNAWLEGIIAEFQDNNIFVEYKSTIVVENSLLEFEIPVADYIAAYDILNIYVNGDRLDDSKYTATTTDVTLTYPINVAGTIVEVVVLKNIDTTGVDVETLSTAVEALGNTVSQLTPRVTALEKYKYKCTGSGDNIALSNICQAFLEGTGAFSGADAYAHMEIEIEGNFNVTNKYSGSGTTASPDIFMALGKLTGSTSTRSLFLNFKKCSRISIPATAVTTVIAGGDIAIEGLEIVCNTGTATTVFGGEKLIVRDTKVNAMGSGDTIGGYCCGVFENVRMSITSTGGDAFGYVSNGTGILTVRGGTIYTYTGLSTKEAVGLYVEANKTTNVLIADGVNIPLNSRAGFYQTDTIKINNGYFSLNSCVLGKAASKYATGDGKTEAGTMLISKVL